MRMKNHIVNHVEAEKIAMFNTACQVVHDSLEKLCCDIEKSMQEAGHVVFAAFHTDYKSLLGGDTSIDAIMQKWERDMRAATGSVLEESEAMFRGLVGGQDAVEESREVDRVIEDAGEADAIIGEVGDADSVIGDVVQRSGSRQAIGKKGSLNSAQPTTKTSPQYIQQTESYEDQKMSKRNSADDRIRTCAPEGSRYQYH